MFTNSLKIETTPSPANQSSNLQLKVTPLAASSFCGRKINDIVNAGMNGIFPTIDLPSIVCDALSQPVTDSELEIADILIDEGQSFSMFCLNTPKTSKYESNVDTKLSHQLSQFFKTEKTYSTQSESLL